MAQSRHTKPEDEKTGGQKFVHEILHPVDSIGDRLREADHRHTVALRLVGWSLVIGILSGLVVGFFRWSITELMIGLHHVYGYATAGHWWVIALIALVSVGLSIFVSWLVISEPASSGSGIPYVEARLRSHDPIDFNWWGILWRKIVGGLCAFSTGAFLGREGPSVQIASCIGMGVSSASHTRVVIGKILSLQAQQQVCLGHSPLPLQEPYS